MKNRAKDCTLSTIFDGSGTIDNSIDSFNRGIVKISTDFISNIAHVDFNYLFHCNVTPGSVCCVGGEMISHKNLQNCVSRSKDRTRYTMTGLCELLLLKSVQTGGSTAVVLVRRGRSARLCTHRRSRTARTGLQDLERTLCIFLLLLS